MGDPCWSSLFLKDCMPWNGPTLEQFVQGHLPWDRLHTTAGEQHEKQVGAQLKSDGLITTLIAHSPAPLPGRR